MKEDTNAVGRKVIAFPNKNKRAKSRFPATELKAGELREIVSPRLRTKSPRLWTDPLIESTKEKPKGEWNGVTIGGRRVYVTHHPFNPECPHALREFWRIG